MADDIQKTIEEIDESLEENTLEKPLPKGVATQHGINERPEEMTSEVYAILMGDPLPPGVEVITEDQRLRNQEYVRQLREASDLSGIDMSPLIHFQQLLFDFGRSSRRAANLLHEAFGRDRIVIKYQVKCRDCNFRFPAQEIRFEMGQPLLLDDMELAGEHADRYQHTVEFRIIEPPCPSLNSEGSEHVVEIEPRTRTLWHRFKAFCKRVIESKWWVLVCLCVIGFEIFSASTQTGIDRWFAVGLVGLWCYNLWSWLKAKWKKKRD